MKYRIFFCLLIIIVLDSCKKHETQILFSGIVIDYDNNTPFPNQLTKIYRYEHHQLNSILNDSTLTNSNGFFQFSYKHDEHDMYLVYVKKDGYVEKFASQYKPLKFYDITSINIDTLIIGQAAVLNICVNNYSDNKEYIIECNINIPPELFNPFADYNPNKHHIHVEDEASFIFERYIYKDNHEVFISWSEYDTFTGDTLDKTTEVIQLIPMDTSYMTIELN